MKKLMALILIFALTAGGCAFAQEDTQGTTYTLAGLDTTQFGGTGLFGGGTFRSWNENLFFTRMQELTGVAFTLTQYTDAAQWTAAKENMTAGADMPDILFKASLTTAECIEMRERGALIDLLPLLEENCPNLWAILQANPDYLKAITLPDGSVAALPYIYVTPIQNCIWINSVWLDNLKLKEPTTAEELVAVLEAFRDRDPNQNGQKDEIPLGFLGAFDLKYLAHAFGLYANDYNIYVENGTLKYMPLDENFRLFISWCRDLYEAGLLDGDGFATADSMRAVTDSDTKPTYGAILATNVASIFSTSWAVDYKPLMPLTYNGKQVYRQTVGNLLRGAFAVTSACKDPAAMLKWVDTLYTEAGGKIAYVGLENTDYLIDGDGTWRYSETVSSDSFFTVTSLISGGGAIPGLAPDAFQKMYNDTSLLSITERLEKIAALSTAPFPYCNLTREQQKQATDMQNALGAYVDLSIARFVLGETEITDASFAAFEEELKTLGAQEFLSFWQGVYDQM